MKTNYVIIHGTFGDPNDHWFPWLKEQLENNGSKCILPSFPTVEDNNYEYRSSILKEYSDEIDENTIFVAHSSAPIFVCKFLMENNLKVKGLISVSGANNFFCDIPEYENVNEVFFINDSKLETIYNNLDFVHCFYSDNDPYIPLKYLESFAKVTKASVSFVEGAGHFNTDAGYKTFPRMLELINSKN